VAARFACHLRAIAGLRALSAAIRRCARASSATNRRKLGQIFGLWHRKRVTPRSRSLAAPARHWLDAWCRRASFLVPFVVTAFRASASSVWRDDLPLARALGLVQAGTEGRVTSVLVELTALLPLGGRWLRASWASAFALALASYLAYLLARRLLERSLTTPRLTPTLALAASLTATLAQSFQLEGTVAGGAPLATALVLGGLLVGFEALGRRDLRYSVALGVIVGLTLAEAHAAALVLLFALGVQGAAHWALPRTRALLGFFGVWRSPRPCAPCHSSCGPCRLRRASTLVTASTPRAWRSWMRPARAPRHCPPGSVTSV